MATVGLTLEIWVLVGYWVLKVIAFALFCFFLGWLGLRALDAMTPQIHERKEIGKDPTATGLFIAGFFLYMGLVLHGAVTTLHGGPLAMDLLMRKLGIVVVAFVVSVLLAVGMFNLLDRLTPLIPFLQLRRSPLGTGLYVFGYLVFLGLITNAALASAF